MSGMWMFLIIFGAIWFARRRGGGCGRTLSEPTRERPEPSAQLTERLEELSTRLERLEEERDFYRDLLGSSRRFRKEPGGAISGPERGAQG